MKTCKQCNLDKEISEYSKCGSYKDQIYYRPECKECTRKYLSSDVGKAAQEKYRNSPNGKLVKQAYRQTEKYIIKRKEYDKIRALTPEKKLQQIQYKQKRFNSDPIYKLGLYMRNRIGNCLKRNKWRKDNRTVTYIGCDFAYLKQIIESKFTEGMSWDNYGKWHIDHVIPLSSAKTPDELYNLCHYTNLQPLWAADNIKKSNHI